jgi:exopolyphosphatase/guanosine-5'-triphosphate,3'-diphosphate pyrophosphatase
VLPLADQAIVRRLSAILRVADGLDRGHSAAVESVTTGLDDRALKISVAPRDPKADLELECWGGSRKADVLAKLLQRDVVISAV